MKELNNLKQILPSPYLKRKVMDRIKEMNNEAPQAMKWIVAAALLINIIVVVGYIKSNQQIEIFDYQFLTIENTIKY
jgi:hypothetical protein